MAWSTPPTWVSGQPITSSFLNNLRDNLLETAAAKATTSGSYFAATGPNALAERSMADGTNSIPETTASATFTNLTGTPGPLVTVTSGTRALVMLTGAMSVNTAGATCYMGLDVSGASTIAATTDRALRHTSAIANASMQASWVGYYTVTAGSNTYTSKYQTSAGTAGFDNRRVTVMPF